MGAGWAPQGPPSEEACGRLPASTSWRAEGRSARTRAAGATGATRVGSARKGAARCPAGASRGGPNFAQGLSPPPGVLRRPLRTRISRGGSVSGALPRWPTGRGAGGSTQRGQHPARACELRGHRPLLGPAPLTCPPRRPGPGPRGLSSDWPVRVGAPLGGARTA